MIHIHTTSGHLTAHDKRVIAAILAAGGKNDTARTPRKKVVIDRTVTPHKAHVTTVETDIFGRRGAVTATARFTYTTHPTPPPQ